MGSESAISFAEVSSQPIVRHTVRALLVDRDDHVLLFHATNPNTGEGFWFPPGGGVEPGEDALTALHRELFEETGLTGVSVEGEAWARRHVFPWHDVVWDYRERIFFAHVDRFDPDTSQLHEDEMADIERWRWWPVAEIASSTETFAPRTFASELALLLSQGMPAQPRPVGA